MARQLKYRIDGGTETTVSVDQPLTITGLTNDQQVSIDIKVVDDGVDSEWSNVVPVTPTAPDIVELPPPPARDKKFLTFWDGQNNDFGNVVQSQSLTDTLNRVESTGKDAIIAGLVFRSLAYLQRTDGSAVQQDAIDGWVEILERIKPTVHAIGKDKTIFILLQDEPYGSTHEFTKWETEELIRQAKDILHTDGQAFYYGYTVPFGNWLGWGGGVDPADNADYFSITFYPFDVSLQSSNWNTESGIRARLRECIAGYRQRTNNPDARVWIVGQGFWAKESGAEWYEPDPDFPTWLYNGILQEELDSIVDGITIYEWQDRNKTLPFFSYGTNNMPDYYSNLQAVLNTIEAS